jgi:KUP system potassium uptake protein
MADNNDRKSHLLTLALAAVGVVYGDIGTSPLYAIRESFQKQNIPTVEANILGILSLVFWSLILVISFKYLIIVMRADNHGEGGILALMESVEHHFKKHKHAVIIAIGLFGAALLYGDGMITPAISVLSAVEGLKVATPVFEPYIIPITITILFLLFLFQKKGSGGIGKIFGPIIIFWFLIIGTLGIMQIIQNTNILRSVNPVHAIDFFGRHGWTGALVLGPVFLVVTGGEALYADMGHFGKKAIRLSWFCLVLPCLMLNYLGQGALLLNNPSAIENPFYHLAPEWGIYPLVFIATVATVIASQAIISGVFSLTYQAVNLGYFPRMRIFHTSEQEEGQVFLPWMNWMLFVTTVGLVLGFRSSSNLAAAYGVAVSTTMVITTILLLGAMRRSWNWNRWTSYGLIAFFLIIDLLFFGANLFKIPDGGWFPIVIAIFFYLVMSTWYKGKKQLHKKMSEIEPPTKEEVEKMQENIKATVDGTAIYLTDQVKTTPPALHLNLEFNKVMHENIIILAMHYKRKPFIDHDDRLKINEIRKNFYIVDAFYGFKQNIQMNVLTDRLNEKIKSLNKEQIFFVVTRSHYIASGNTGLSKWRKKLFIFLSDNDMPATKYFNLPSKKTLEIGIRLEF